MKLPHELAVLALVLLVAGSCTSAAEPDASSTVPTAPTAMPITVACEAAFAEAAEVGGESDSIEDLYPAALACTRMDEWATGSGLYPAALDGADPLVFAQVM